MISQTQADWFADTFGKLVRNIEVAVMGKTKVVELTLCCLLSEGHLLLEDVPGTGKTSLAKALANTVEGKHSRIQFTPDLLPSDVTGVTMYNQQNGAFEYHKGPIFATIVLADEINRASPKTQSALLEVMEEGRVTTDGVTYPVGAPFMVVATQNPIEQAGTYRLPEAQLDRFLMRTSIGYPDQATSIALLADVSTRDRSAAVGKLVASAAVVDMAKLASTVFVDPSILAYVTEIAEQTRSSADTRLGVSVRGCQGHVRAAKTWAAAHGRTFVTPDDIKELAGAILAHRVLLTPEAEFAGTTATQVITRIVGSIEPPAQRRQTT